MTKTLLLHSKINGGGKWGKIRNQAMQGPRYGKYLGHCADRILILAKMWAPLIFSYLEPIYLCNLATWANRKCQAYRIIPESLITDVDWLKFIVFTCKSKLMRGSTYFRHSDELVMLMSQHMMWWIVHEPYPYLMMGSAGLVSSMPNKAQRTFLT